MLLFLAMDTQWRFAGLGQRVGLDYAMIEPTARLAGVAIEPREPLFVQLRTMEFAALKFLGERAKQDRGR